MSQIFNRHANIYSRLSILAVIVFIGALGGALALLNVSGYNTRQDEFIEQPIQFSHAHHVGGIGIDCRYCHTSVEESSFANIPPTKTCMNCHSQIWTGAPILEPVRASFRDNKPLMYQAAPLLMGWCLNCHRAPEKFLRPRDQVFNMNYVPDPEEGQIAIGTRLKQEYNVASVEHLTSCSTCHR